MIETKVSCDHIGYCGRNVPLKQVLENGDWFEIHSTENSITIERFSGTKEGVRTACPLHGEQVATDALSRLEIFKVKEKEYAPPPRMAPESL